MIRRDKLNKVIIIFLFLVNIVLLNMPMEVYSVDLEAGEQIFSANCSACHAGGNNAIITEKTLKKDALELNGMNDIAAIMTQVKNGKNAMPSFGSRLADEDINNVANYVLSKSEQGWDS